MGVMKLVMFFFVVRVHVCANGRARGFLQEFGVLNVVSDLRYLSLVRVPFPSQS